MASVSGSQGSTPTPAAHRLPAPMWHAEAPPRTRSGVSPAARVLEIPLALLLLLLAAPLLAVGALVLWLESGRPVFFGHVRVGLHGRPFRCWKLRTMDADAAERLESDPALRRRYVQNGYKLPAEEDPRVTRSGRLLRRRYLDELPQLFNLLNGTMSLVGPRPLVEEELSEFGEDAALLLSRRPGITGAWTSLGSRRPQYPERARIELEYVRTRSLRGDVSIVLRSLRVVAGGQGAQ